MVEACTLAQSRAHSSKILTGTERSVSTLHGSGQIKLPLVPPPLAQAVMSHASDKVSAELDKLAGADDLKPGFASIERRLR